MITCFGSSILVRLWPCAASTKTGVSSARELSQNSQRCVGWRGLVGFVLHGHSSPFSLPPYHCPCLPPSLLSTSQLAESPEADPHKSPPCSFPCLSLQVYQHFFASMSVFKTNNKYILHFLDINLNPNFPAI